MVYLYSGISLGHENKISENGIDYVKFKDLDFIDEVQNNTIRIKNVKENTQEDIKINELNKYFNIKEENKYAYKH